MKNKIVLISLCVVMVFALVGVVLKCIGGITGSSILSSYDVPTDVEIVASYVREGRAYATVRNTGDKPIRDIKVAIVGYDATGNPVNLNGNTVYTTADFKTINLMPGTTSPVQETWSLNNNVKYVDVTVAEITYKDESVWSTGGLDAWAKDSSNGFSIEKYKQSVTDMADLAKAAESNPYIEITDSVKYDDNKLSARDDLDLDAKNTSDQVIQKFTFIILEYDDNGYAINVSPYQFATTNAITADVDPANLPPGEVAGWNWTLIFDEDCKNYKTLVYQVEFKDGTTWTNDNALPWMIYNEDVR